MQKPFFIALALIALTASPALAESTAEKVDQAKEQPAKAESGSENKEIEAPKGNMRKEARPAKSRKGQ